MSVSVDDDVISHREPAQQNRAASGRRRRLPGGVGWTAIGSRGGTLRFARRRWFAGPGVRAAGAARTSFPALSSRAPQGGTHGHARRAPTCALHERQVRPGRPDPHVPAAGGRLRSEAEPRRPGRRPDGHATGARTTAPTIPPIAERTAPPPDSPMQVVRRATREDVLRRFRQEQREREARRICLLKIRERGLQMKLVKVEQMFDDSKLVISFTAEGRVDFRGLVRELASEFKARIEMRQIGARDEAKLLGGYGTCGRPLCCTTWLPSFEPISIKMAQAPEPQPEPLAAVRGVRPAEVLSAVRASQRQRRAACGVARTNRAATAAPAGAAAGAPADARRVGAVRVAAAPEPAVRDRGSTADRGDDGRSGWHRPRDRPRRDRRPAGHRGLRAGAVRSANRGRAGAVPARGSCRRRRGGPRFEAGRAGGRRRPGGPARTPSRRDRFTRRRWPWPVRRGAGTPRCSPS